MVVLPIATIRAGTQSYRDDNITRTYDDLPRATKPVAVASIIVWATTVAVSFYCK